MFVLIAAFFAFAQPAHAGAYTAKVYSLNNEKLIYSLQSKDMVSGATKTIESEFHSPDGKLASRETTEVQGQDPGQLVKYTAEIEDPKETGTVEVRNGRIYFTYISAGKTSKDDEKADGIVLVPPLVVPYLRANWDKLMKGDTIEARFAVPERRETIGFEFYKSGEKTQDGHAIVGIVMKPSSFIIAAIRSPMTFVFDKSTRNVREFKGQILPKKDGKTQDADLFYNQ